ncbi:DUF6777 domain-containing protein [Gordonia polyisoprenivorans]|uniref:DUF6777 domain-containing protein n=1 Tax=Gordonia polyisoprenivorans TaxID=84595 RepID=UPI000B99EF63|nr:DUF6777 domain-containing protein [Gordonia polyisoprenivorans]OZC33236.1 hypothetical protein CJJ17_18415 [Gordonia polyisoprenivorans]
MSYYPPGPPTYPSMPFGAVPPEPQPRNRRNLTLILAAIVAVLALVFASVVVIVLKNKKGEFHIPFLSLTSADAPGDAPFMAQPNLTNKPLDNGLRLSAQTGAPNQGTRLVSGTTPGLYVGGSTSCDPAGLGNFLAQHPSQAAAWASVYGISTQAIPYYLDTLTPVILSADTWVTNYSYTGGSAVPFQDVLQAGTSVLVDSAGVPRVRCQCGNPLGPAASAPIGGYRIRGTHWQGYQVNYITRVAYNTQNVTVVNNTTTVINQAPAQANTPAAGAAALLTLLNPDTRQLFDRTVGGLLDLSGQPPLTEALPTPASLNVPLAARSDEAAAQNGLARAGETAAAPEVTQMAESNGNTPPTEGQTTEAASGTESGTDTSAADATSSEETSTASSSTTTSSDTSSSASSSSSAAPSPTVFSGSGDSIGSFSFTENNQSVTCQAPSQETTGSVSLTCSDGLSRSIYQSSLSQSSVTSATDSTGIWRLSLGSTSVPITSATWQTLIATTTETTTAETPTATETTEVPTTTEETTTETTEETTETPTTIPAG